MELHYLPKIDLRDVKMVDGLLVRFGAENWREDKVEQERIARVMDWIIYGDRNKKANKNEI